MINVTYARPSLIRSLMKNMNCSQSRASYLLETTLQILTDAFSQGITVKIAGFGTFEVRQKAKRVGRNPRTKEEVIIKERKTLTFKPSKILKASIEDGRYEKEYKKAV